MRLRDSLYLGHFFEKCYNVDDSYLIFKNISLSLISKRLNDYIIYQ